jgi:Uma2 family endonuclease
MPPTEGRTSKRNFSLLGQIWAGVEKNPDMGVGFDFSTQFNLPNGGDRSPDAA